EWCFHYGSARWARVAPTRQGRRNGVPVLGAARSIAGALTVATPTIFLIDDHASVRDALGEMLGVLGYSVKAYESADAFLAAIDERELGCIVADVRMPGTDGIGLVRELARRAIALPVVLISGHADVPMAVAAIKTGGQDFIGKAGDDRQMVPGSNGRHATGY